MLICATITICDGTARTILFLCDDFFAMLYTDYVLKTMFPPGTTYSVSPYLIFGDLARNILWIIMCRMKEMVTSKNRMKSQKCKHMYSSSNVCVITHDIGIFHLNIREKLKWVKVQNAFNYIKSQTRRKEQQE